MSKAAPKHEVATSAELLELLTASGELAVVQYSPTGKIIELSEAAAKVFDITAAVIPADADHSYLHPAGELARRFESPSDHPSPLHINGFVRSGKGESIPVAITMMQHAETKNWLALYKDQSVLFAANRRNEELRDSIHRSKEQTEKEAEFLRELLRHTIETIQIGIILQEVNTGMIAYVNDGFEKLTGFSKFELEGAYLQTLLDKYPETRARLLGYTELLRETLHNHEALPPSAHWEVDFPSGRKSIETYGRPIFVEEHPSPYIMLIIEDHTDRQRLQVQLVQSEKLAAIGQLAAGIAHEMRNPLTTIYNALYDLSEIIENPTPDIAEDIDVSMEEIKRVQEIINNLLDFAREAERSSGKSNLNDVLQRTIRLVQHDLSNKRIQLQWSLSEIPEVAINNNALKQIIINLITNAAQAMSHGGTLTIKTQVKTGRVPLRAASLIDKRAGENFYHAAESSSEVQRIRETSSSDQYVILEITDTGTGIPESILPNIFNPFYTTKPPGNGTGLGLSVVHSLIQDAGGAISVKTEVGVGSTFIIALPCHQAEFS